MEINATVLFSQFNKILRDGIIPSINLFMNFLIYRTMAENKTQKFIYRGMEYQYRILEQSLRRFKENTKKSILSELRLGGEHTMRVFYYTVCWCGTFVSEEQFIADWKLGNIHFRTGNGRRVKQFSPIEIGILIRNAVIKYRLEY